MKYSTYVISLKEEISRRKNIKTQLDNLNIKFDFFDAIDLRNSNPAELNEKCKDNTNLNRKLTSGEIGCALSHINIYRKTISNEENWSWIIEDDALLDNVSNSKINQIISLANKYNADIIILGYSKLSPDDTTNFYIKEPVKRICKSKDGYTLGVPWKNWTCGTVSYLINKNGAKKILTRYMKSDEKIETVADDWLFFEKKCDLKILHCRPLIIYEDYKNHISAIEKERSIVAKKTITSLEIIRLARGVIRFLIMSIIKK
ncbi:glycosyltransferase family 25 protein [Morganella morganii]|uniref:Glycosyltransferase family 25 protein n=1 Tax=bacterium 19GA11TI05 TaxID=2920688 RepID=A0AAU6TVA2_UNCXX|nr:glycosyltransferase family 25 protein [Morganella morganii]MDW7795351.1 glycosyltransferase family 25 protein [Morganella morganii]HDS3819724.1 glycosyltransferase family 25 protein [Morganella morganii subsp. morganii]